jgi:hypothetical protein
MKLKFSSYLIEVKSVVIRFEISSKVPGTGLEPAHLSIPEPKSGASTNSAIPACGRDSTGARTRGKHTLWGGGIRLWTVGVAALMWT